MRNKVFLMKIVGLLGIIFTSQTLINLLTNMILNSTVLKLSIKLELSGIFIIVFNILLLIVSIISYVIASEQAKSLVLVEQKNQAKTKLEYQVVGIVLVLMMILQLPGLISHMLRYIEIPKSSSIGYEMLKKSVVIQVVTSSISIVYYLILSVLLITHKSSTHKTFLLQDDHQNETDFQF